MDHNWFLNLINCNDFKEIKDRFLFQKFSPDTLLITIIAINIYKRNSENKNIKWSTFIRSFWEYLYNLENINISGKIDDKIETTRSCISILKNLSLMDEEFNINKSFENFILNHLESAKRNINNSILFFIEYSGIIIDKLSNNDVVDYTKYKTLKSFVEKSTKRKDIINNFKNNAGFDTNKIKEPTRLLNRPLKILWFQKNNKKFGSEIFYFKKWINQLDFQSILSLNGFNYIDHDTGFSKKNLNKLKKLLENNDEIYLGSKKYNQIRNLITKNFRDKIKSDNSFLLDDFNELYNNDFKSNIFEAAHYYPVYKIINDLVKFKNNENITKKIINLTNSKNNGLFIPFTYHKLYDKGILELDLNNKKFIIKNEYKKYEKIIKELGYSDKNKINDHKIKAIKEFEKEYKKILEPL